MARYLISLDAAVHTDDSAATAALTAVGASVEKTFSFPLTYEIEATAEQLAAMTGVLQSIERDSPVSIELQALNKDHLDYVVRKSSLDTAVYNPVNRGAGQHVYLVDTGVRASHEQFANSSINNLHSAFAADPAVSDFDDTHGHGTAMASVIVGGDLGASSDATLHNVKLFSTGSSTVVIGDVLDAFDAILSHHNNNNPAHPKVVSMSWTTSQNNFIDAKVIEMNNSNLIMVAAAGNTGEDVNTKSPAGVDIIVTVGAFDRNYQVAPFNNGPWAGTTGPAAFNNYGAQLDIFALGVNVDAAGITSNSAYETVSGTSISAAVVAGVAAQYIARYNGKTSNELKDIILQEGHLLARKYLTFDAGVDYSAVYKSIITTDNAGVALLTAVPSGRILNVQNGTAGNVDLGLNTAATDVAVLDFAPTPPFVTVDTATGIVNVDATALDPAANLVPGIYVFALRGNVGGGVEVEEFSIGLYENDASELELATQYYYDADTGSYDPVVEYMVGNTSKN